MAMQPTWADTPLTRCATAALPLLIEAHVKLFALAGPRASDLERQLSDLFERMIAMAGEVQAYGNTWWRHEGELGELADKLRAATQEYDTI